MNSSRQFTASFCGSSLSDRRVTNPHHNMCADRIFARPELARLQRRSPSAPAPARSCLETGEWHSLIPASTVINNRTSITGACTGLIAGAPPLLVLVYRPFAISGQ
jgi:hypothetical protein